MSTLELVLLYAILCAIAAPFFWHAIRGDKRSRRGRFQYRIGLVTTKQRKGTTMQISLTNE